MTAHAEPVEDIDALMERASVALEATKYFEVERLGSRALRTAHQSRDYDRLARILLPLQESRRLRRQQAMDTGRITTVTSTISSDSLRAGCYIFAPTATAAAARALRDAADSLHIPVVAFAIAPGPRAQCIISVHGAAPLAADIPPARPLTREWIESALESLGDEALATLDPRAAPAEKIDRLIAMLDAHRDHEKLHQRLADECRRALSTPAGR